VIGVHVLSLAKLAPLSGTVVLNVEPSMEGKHVVCFMRRAGALLEHVRFIAKLLTGMNGKIAPHPVVQESEFTRGLSFGMRCTAAIYARYSNFRGHVTVMSRAHYIAKFPSGTSGACVQRRVVKVHKLVTGLSLCNTDMEVTPALFYRNGKNVTLIHALLIA
jgi:hypothetical protein